MVTQKDDVAIKLCLSRKPGQEDLEWTDAKLKIESKTVARVERIIGGSYTVMAVRVLHLSPRRKILGRE